MCTIWLLEHYNFIFVVNLIIIIETKYRRKNYIRISVSIKNSNMPFNTKFEKHSLLQKT